MNSVTINSLSVVFAIALHAGLAVFLMMNWDSTSEFETTEVQPYYINATVVNENPHKAREEREAAKAAAAQQRAREAAKKRDAELQARINRNRLEAERLREEARKKQEELEKRKTTPVPETVVEETVEDTDVVVDEAERQRAEQELAMLITEEQIYRQAVTDDEKAMAYVAQIQREIIQNWSRPPSARNGMEALLRVFLVPTGEVVNVTVEESSGNDAFDRSAILAVQKAGKFQVPSDLRQFERNFREFEVLFRPEDLRL